MKTYYEVRVTQTGKTAGSKEPSGHGYSIYNDFTKRFTTIKEAKEYIKSTYQGHKRSKMYNVNDTDGVAKHVGYTYSWTEKSDYHTYYMCDWIEVSEIKATTIII